MYEIFQLVTKYLNKKTLCRLRTVSREVHDYIKKPKPFIEEKLKRQRDKNNKNNIINIINNIKIVPKKYIHITKVVRHRPQTKSIIYKVGSEILYRNLIFLDIDFPPPKKIIYRPNGTTFIELYSRNDSRGHRTCSGRTLLFPLVVPQRNFSVTGPGYKLGSKHG